MNIQQEIIDWLYTRQNWQQEAALRIFKKNELSIEDIDEIYEFSKTMEGQESSKTRVFPGLSFSNENEINLRLCSIGNIQGIDKLSPKKPLNFDKEKITVIFGNNGSGKSGYTRILKKMCGKTHALELKPNVFKPQLEEQSCRIVYELNGEKKELAWDNSDYIPNDLANIDIFDSVCGNFYLQKSTETSYKPGILIFFDKLISLCGDVNKRLELEKCNLPSKLPQIPPEYITTNVGQKYHQLEKNPDKNIEASVFMWEDKDEIELNLLEEQLKNDDPTQLIKQKRIQKEQLEELYEALHSALDKVSLAECIRLNELKLNAKRARQEAEYGAARIKQLPLKGVGSPTWRALWEAARIFSQEEAYKDIDFPNINSDANCLLCQQKLSVEASKRLLNFEDYINSTLSIIATQAEEERDIALNELPTIPLEKELQTILIAVGLEQDKLLPELKDIWDSIKTIVDEIKNQSNLAVMGLEKESYPFVFRLKGLIDELQEQVIQSSLSIAGFDRGKANADRNELRAKKWISLQKAAIETEIVRIKEIKKLNTFMNNTKTNGISQKAGVITQKVITNAYIARFNRELKNLGANGIQVELLTTNVIKGNTQYAIALKGVSHNKHAPKNILSDGEQRVVALAAFLADVTGKESKMPFVLDDPISSLDQEYEEKTINRLIELSQERQVIVFTHRLSFLGILEGKISPNVICVRSEPWGTGEPGEIPIYGKKPEKALRHLLESRIKQAKNVLESRGTGEYYPLAKAICTDLRIIIERIVEFILLGDIVQRHRREVMTKGKIHLLINIKRTDCDMFDDLMTRYSCYEHSQSLESPIDVPQPAQLEADIQKLLSWCEDFLSRKES